MTIELPHYDNEDLAAFTAMQLIDNMIKDEDRVPRNVIDECVKRGEQMLDVLAPITASADELDDEDSGRWWLQLHAVMIIGLMPGERAGKLLVNCVRNMSRDEDNNLQEWFSGYWPALTENKPASVIEKLRNFCVNKQMPWFMRSNLTDAIIASAYHHGENELEQALDWAAQLVKDEEEDWEFRLNTANTLIDFPRDRYQGLLTEIAARQSGFGVHFDQKDINKAYINHKDQPGWERFSNPWSFYEPDEITKRQQRWLEEARHELEEQRFDEELIMGPDGGLKNFSDFNESQPYQRETPKIGRNDPCPCGSGKKYKKCCLN